MPTNNIEIRSEEVQEIIGFIPHWLVRSGVTVIFIVVFMLFAGSFFFKYPDVIVAKATITGNTPPANLKARTNGKITQIFISDKQKVKKDEVLAIIENTCNYSDFLLLKGLTRGATPSRTPSNLKLGELQNYYSSYQKQISDYQNFIEINYHAKKIESIEKQISEYQIYIQNIQKQVSLSREELKIQAKQFKRDSILFVSKVISADEYEKSQTAFLQKKSSHESAKNTISTTKIQINNLEQSILDLKLQFREQDKQKKQAIAESLEQLKAQMLIWEQNYLLKSPFEGKAVFSKIWSNYQNVSAGDVVFTILPLEAKQPMAELNFGSDTVTLKKCSTLKKQPEVFKQQIQARADLPLIGAGKVKIGQNVNIKLIGYPYQQYGMLKGKVSKISAVNNGENYTVSIIFPNELTTNYNIKIPFKQNMQASAEILTEELPLIARFFNPIKTLFYN